MKFNAAMVRTVPRGKFPSQECLAETSCFLPTGLHGGTERGSWQEFLRRLVYRCKDGRGIICWCEVTCWWHNRRISQGNTECSLSRLGGRLDWYQYLRGHNFLMAVTMPSRVVSVGYVLVNQADNAIKKENFDLWCPWPGTDVCPKIRATWIASSPLYSSRLACRCLIYNLQLLLWHLGETLPLMHLPIDISTPWLEEMSSLASRISKRELR